MPDEKTLVEKLRDIATYLIVVRGHGAMGGTVAKAADELERISGPPAIEPTNPYRPETELVRVPREDEEALTDRRVPVRIGLDERTRFDRKGVGDQ